MPPRPLRACIAVVCLTENHFCWPALLGAERGSSSGPVDHMANALHPQTAGGQGHKNPCCDLHRFLEPQTWPVLLR